MIPLYQTAVKNITDRLEWNNEWKNVRGIWNTWVMTSKARTWSDEPSSSYTTQPPIAFPLLSPPLLSFYPSRCYAQILYNPYYITHVYTCIGASSWQCAVFSWADPNPLGAPGGKAKTKGAKPVILDGEEKKRRAKWDVRNLYKKRNMHTHSHEGYVNHHTMHGTAMCPKGTYALPKY